MQQAARRPQLLVGPAALLLISSLSPTGAWACQCGHIGSVAEEYAPAAGVFEGRVVSLRNLEPAWRSARRRIVYRMYDFFGAMPPAWIQREITDLVTSHRYGQVVTFEVSVYWKGVSGKRVDVVTGFGGGDCGYPFRIDEEYRVWAQLAHDGSAKGRLETGICTRTMEALSSRLEPLPPDPAQYLH
jgi:hypothetical protein